MPRRPVSVPVPDDVKPLLAAIGKVAAERAVAAYAVGGCVRDWLLGIMDTLDLDVTVEGDGIGLARRVADRLGGTVVVHEQFGTATVELPTKPPRKVDFATCRKETYAKPAAYPKVAPGSLKDDLFRRDFTINAMAMEIRPETFGRLVDPFGGWADLTARRLRILHAKSFRDDPSRIVRGMRFMRRYALAIEPSTARALKAALDADALADLNRGRLRRELERFDNDRTRYGSGRAAD